MTKIISRDYPASFKPSDCAMHVWRPDGKRHEIFLRDLKYGPRR
jgi:hypothetical protein